MLQEYDILLGTDFLFKNNIILDFTSKELVTPHGSCKFINSPKSISRHSKISCNSTRVIPPQSVAHLVGKLDMPQHECRDYIGLVTPNQQLAPRSKIFMAHSVTYSDRNKVILQVINPTDVPITNYHLQEQNYGYFWAS